MQTVTFTTQTQKTRSLLMFTVGNCCCTLMTWMGTVILCDITEGLFPEQRKYIRQDVNDGFFDSSLVQWNRKPEWLKMSLFFFNRLLPSAPYSPCSPRLADMKKKVASRRASLSAFLHQRLVWLLYYCPAVSRHVRSHWANERCDGLCDTVWSNRQDRAALTD